MLSHATATIEVIVSNAIRNATETNAKKRQRYRERKEAKGITRSTRATRVKVRHTLFSFKSCLTLKAAVELEVQAREDARL